MKTKDITEIKEGIAHLLKKQENISISMQGVKTELRIQNQSRYLNTIGNKDKR